MDDIRARLIKCFTTVFPDMPAQDAPRASTASAAAWDSVAHITLLTVISEEFGIPVDIEDSEHLTSFDNLLEHVRRSKGA